MASSTISYTWRDKNALQGFRSGVSLHSHTNHSRETLDFLANFGNQYPVIRPLLTRWSANRNKVQAANQLRGELLDAADDRQTGLRPGEPAD